MNTPVPPRFVPTLTEVVKLAPLSGAGPAVPPVGNSAVSGTPAILEEQMVQRVMRRVDLVLERRLREVIGQLILEHTQSLAPRLREEIEAVVRESMIQAFAHEASPASGRK